MKTYVKIADTVAERIRTGELRTGERLPPQRNFAYENGIANSTAGRVYAELVKRGLIEGEVGRGSYVRAWPPQADQLTLLEIRKDVAIDMENSYPLLPGQSKMMANALESLIRPESLEKAILPIAVMDDDYLTLHKKIASRFLGSGGWQPNPDFILFPGCGRQAIGSAITALVPAGGRLGVEELTYPILKGLADNLGRKLIPISVDHEGMVPEALLSTHKAKALDAVYIQPTLHNPTGVSMSVERRKAIAQFVCEQELAIIEDQVYRFLQSRNLPSIAKFAPDHVVLIDSLSKRVAPGLSVGFVAAPERYASAISVVMMQLGWVAGAFSIEAVTRWISDGTIEKMDALKRDDIARRQIIARGILKEHATGCSKQASYLWVELPTCWESDRFALAAKQIGIAVAPGSAFGIGFAPNAVRVSITTPSVDELDYSLRQIRSLLQSDGGERNAPA